MGWASVSIRPRDTGTEERYDQLLGGAARERITRHGSVAESGQTGPAEIRVPFGHCHPDVVGLRPTKVARNSGGSGHAVRLCVNCGRSLLGSGTTAHSDAVAWYWHCRPCSQLAAEQLELLADQPGGSPIRIYRCRLCGSLRSCRPGWLTRCHICLDERGHGPLITDAAQRFRSVHSGDAERLPSAPLVSEALGRDTDQAAVEASAALVLATAIRRAERPGWDVVATDVHGLPWTGSKTAATSHGTWATHQACGTIAKLRPGSIDCPACGPAKGSRTHLARRDDPYLLYLVVHQGWQKFGIGDYRRVRSHQRGGAEVIQVLRAPFAHVVLAEAALKRLHRDQIAGRTRRGMISSFGQGTEVTRRRALISLTDVLPDGHDVTYWFR
jgi:hypothetical protein